LFPCHRVQANFPGQKLGLLGRDQPKLLWDEHGGTFVLRVEGLEVAEAPELEGEAMIQIEVDLAEPESLAHRIEDFAGRHSLRLGPEPAAIVISEAPILVACHVPVKQLFIYCEAPRLRLQRSSVETLELQISGAFKARGVPCQETDLIIHLETAAMCRILAGLLAWARKGQ
ncbi:MAG: hypothetical protein M1438_18825, partial [Deltaproteobacteria bacterium]|nr:hypothetical protein [Deltaproteobacteria bacterium]